MSCEQNNDNNEVKKVTTRHYITASGEVHEAKHYYYTKYNRRGRPNMENKKKLRRLLTFINDENCKKILDYINENKLVDTVTES